MGDFTKNLQRMWAGVLAIVVVLVSATGPAPTLAAKSQSVKSISLKKPIIKKLALKKGEKFLLKVNVKPTALKKEIKYSSSKKSVVSVNKNGKLTAKKPGKSTVTIASKTKPVRRVKIKVTVYKKFNQAKKVVLNKKKATIVVGNKMQLKATVKPQKATVKKVTYVSSKKKVASVSKKGIVTAKKAGKTKITAYAEDGRGAKAVCKLTVKSADDPSGTDTPASQPPAGKTDTPVSQPPAEASGAPAATPSEMPELSKDKVGITYAGKTASIYIDEKGEDFQGLKLVASSFAKDVSMVAADGSEPEILTKAEELAGTTIIAGTIGNNDIIDSMITAGTLDVTEIQGKWETYKIQVVENPVDNVNQAIIVVGSDKRGTIYGIYHISELMGVSPWVYWGDAVPDTKEEIVFNNSELNITSKEPSVKYRGIFLNDEAPSLTGWVKNKFGGYNEEFYQLVYELILRCKGNYLWPAMWSDTFSEDGKSKPIANAELADQYGIVMGTSHHEPLCRAGVEWQNTYKKYGDSNLWDFNENSGAITKFWEDGVKRNKAYENIFTLGMRGEADSSLGGGLEENIELLKNVITTQKEILSDNNLSDAPQVLTVYKEVEDYWHGTEEIPGLKSWSTLDDVTIMLCDDNFGNMRTLPTEAERDRKGGWGMYYHFDYHGGPTSYEWVNTVEINKIWEQMTMAYDYGIDNIWIVNVGDLKPMEMNISYFLDLAYDYDTYGKNGLNKAEDYMKQWVGQQFGKSLNEAQKEGVVSILEDYTWLNGSCKPETLKSSTYHVTNYNEAMEVLGRIEQMSNKAEECKELIPEDLQAAYFELVYFPAMASANVAKIQIYSGLNEYYYELGSAAANLYAVLLEQAIERDQELEEIYNSEMPGVGTKWKYMMSSPHVGFVTWDSTGWGYPESKWLTLPDNAGMLVSLQNQEGAVSKGEKTLDDFTSMNQESYTVSVTNSGSEAFSYTVSPSDEWIKVSKSVGRVTMQDSFEVSVDWSMVTEDKVGEITVEGADTSVTIVVNARVYDTKNLAEKTYVYANGYASILAGNYVASVAGADGAQFKKIDKYGKMGQAVKVFPSNVSYVDRGEQAPYTEYQVYMEEAGTYKLTAYTAPSNNVDRDTISIRFGLSANDGAMEVVDTINGANFEPGAYSGSWTTDVKMNGRKKEIEVELREGVNTIRFYAIDPALVLQKLVVSEGPVKDSHFGPAESYFAGKTTDAKTAVTGPSFDRSAFPGIVNAASYEGSMAPEEPSLTVKEGDEYSYPVIVTEENMYQMALSAHSEKGAVVKLLWDGKEIGSTEIAAEDTIYWINADINMTPGEGILSLVVQSGQVQIDYIKAKGKETAGAQSVFISTSSEIKGHEAVLAYDGETKTTWKAAASDPKPSITFDFDEEYSIDRFALSQNGNGVTGYEVQILDGENFRTVYKGDEIINGAVVFIQGKEVIKSQKVRFVFEGTDVEISEISLTPYTNWAMEDNVKLSGEKNTGGSVDVPDSIADGDRITKGMEASVGASTDSKRHIVTMEFSQMRTIDTVRIVSLQKSESEAAGKGGIPDLGMTSDRAQYSYRVSYYDGAGWKEIGATVRPSSGDSKVFNEFELKKAVQATAIRVEVYTSNWIRINELEAVQTQKFVPAIADTTTEFTQAATQFDVKLSGEISVGRIVVDGAYGDFSYYYYDGTKNDYTKIPETDIDVIKVSGGCYAIPAGEIRTDRIRIVSEEEVEIASVHVYEAPKKEEAATEKNMFLETFETGVGNIGSWAGAAMDVTKNEAYEGKKGLLVTNRTEDWCAATLNIGNILGASDKTTEYTASFYVKNADASKTLPLIMKICNSSGNDLAQSEVINITGSEWTLVEYKFHMESSEFQYLKIQTENDKKDANGRVSDFYLDNVRISVPLEGCKCDLQRPVIKNDAEVSIPYGKESKKIELAVSAEYGDCHTFGHENSEVKYSYTLADNTDGIAVLTRDSIRFTGEGRAVVRVRAELNGIVRYSMKEFVVTKATGRPETYKNYAAAENGGTAVVPAGGEGSADNLIDGNRTYSASKRWRKQTSSAYIEVYFDGIREIDEVYFYSQQDSGTGEADPDDAMTSSLTHPSLSFSYMKDGEWVLFEGGTITGNDKVKCGIRVEDAVRTPAIRVDINSAVSGWVRAIEVEAFGDVVQTSDCICQLGTPVITSNKEVEVDKQTSEGSLQLTADAVYYASGCSGEGHSVAKPEFTYEIVEDAANIAEIKGDTISFSGMGTIKVKVTASLNGIQKSKVEEINAVKAGYTNFALATNGTTTSCSEGSENGTADAVIDGDTSFSNGKRWRTSKFPAFVELDFGQERTIDTINLFSQQDSGNVTPTKDMTGKMVIKSMKLSYWSKEKGDWVTFTNGDVTDNDRIWYQLILNEEITTSKIRVDMTGATDGWARIIEIEAWGYEK